MKNLFFSLVCLLMTISLLATPQASDLLVVNNDTLAIYPFILNDILKDEDVSNVYTQIYQKPIPISSACWRGYRALFQIRNDSLFLNKILSCIGKEDINLSLLFPSAGNNGLFINWYSDTLTNLKNRVIYHHGDYRGGFYEYETDFIFEKGILKKIDKYHNDLRPSTYTQNDLMIMEFLKTNINYGNIDQVNEDVRVVVRINEVDSTGKIIDAEIVKGYRDDYDKEALRVIYSIPEWDYIERRGKVIKVPWTIPLRFEAKE